MFFIIYLFLLLLSYFICRIFIYHIFICLIINLFLSCLFLLSYFICYVFLFFFYLLWPMFLAGSRPNSDPKLVAQSRPIGRPQTLTWSSSHELCMAFFLHVSSDSKACWLRHLFSASCTYLPATSSSPKTLQTLLLQVASAPERPCFASYSPLVFLRRQLRLTCSSSTAILFPSPCGYSPYCTSPLLSTSPPSTCMKTHRPSYSP